MIAGADKKRDVLQNAGARYRTSSPDRGVPKSTVGSERALADLQERVLLVYVLFKLSVYRTR